MKKQQYFSGIILIGFGGYFLLQSANIALLQQFLGWQTLLMIVGFAFLWQGYAGKENEMIFPGVILFGFGLHFHVVTHLQIWPDHIGIFLLIIALGFMLRYQKTKNGLTQGIIFLIIALGLLFKDQTTLWFGTLETKVSYVTKFWPIVLILFGLYIVVKKKK